MILNKEAFIAEFQATYGFEPYALYCLATGKQIGFYQHDEFSEILGQLDPDVEMAIDDLAIRAIASMRPSLKWNKLRTESLNEMRILAPVETMAYLLNRLLTPTGNSKDSWFDTQLNRIKLFNKLLADAQSLGTIGTTAFDSTMLMLLEIEAKLHLVNEDSPVTCKEILSAEDSVGFLANRLRGWHAKRVKYHAEAEAEAQFFASNPGGRKAYFTAWMEQAPPSATQLVKREKQSMDNFMAAVVSELMGTARDRPTAMRPVIEESTKVVVPSTKMPKRFGAGK